MPLRANILLLGNPFYKWSNWNQKSSRENKYLFKVSNRDTIKRFDIFKVNNNDRKVMTSFCSGVDRVP